MVIRRPGRETALTREETAQLDRYRLQVEQDLELHAQWQQAARSGSYREFPLIPDQHGLGGTTGFFDAFPIRGMGTVPVMGAIQEVFYDRARVPARERAQAAQAICRQVQEFALRYYLRVEKRANPQAVPELNQPQPPPPLDRLSWCPPIGTPLVGSLNQQIYWKPNGASPRAVPREERFAIVDLRTIGREFEWVIVKTQITDFTFSWTLGATAARWPTLAVPVPQCLHLALVPELITNVDNPAPGILGIYGPGVAFLEPPGRTLLAYGPDKFQPSFEQVQFHVFADGQIRVRIPWVTNQPRQILDIPLNPLALTLDFARYLRGGACDSLFPASMPGASWLAGLSAIGPSFDPVTAFISGINLLTAGAAGRELGYSKDQLNQQMLFLHCLESFNTLLGTLPVWKEVPDWLDEPALPQWIRTGFWGGGEGARD